MLRVPWPGRAEPGANPVFPPPSLGPIPTSADRVQEADTAQTAESAQPCPKGTQAGGVTGKNPKKPRPDDRNARVQRSREAHAQYGTFSS